MEALKQVKATLLVPILQNHPAESPLDSGDTVSSGVNCSFDAEIPRRRKQMDAVAYSSYTTVPFREITFNLKLTSQPRQTPRGIPTRNYRHLSPIRYSDFSVPSFSIVPRPPPPSLHRKTQSLIGNNPMTAAIVRKRPVLRGQIGLSREAGRRAKSVTRRTGRDNFVCQKREADRVFYYFGKRNWKAAEM